MVSSLSRPETAVSKAWSSSQSLTFQDVEICYDDGFLVADVEPRHGPILLHEPPQAVV